MLVRNATRADLFRVLVLEHQCFDASLREGADVYADRIDNHFSIVVAREESPEKLLGALFVEGSRIVSNAVFTSCRGEGLSGKMLDHALGQLGRPVSLEVGDTWQTARKLYEGRGFVYTGETSIRGDHHMLHMILL